MEGTAPQIPITQVPQAPPVVPQIPPELTEQIPPLNPEKGLKTKKSLIYIIILPVLIIMVYIIFIAIAYWNCSKITPKACEINKCGFSLSGFNLTSDIKDDCCGNKICEAGEAYPECMDCPNCDDENKCTSDSYDYNNNECVNEPILDVVCCGNTLCEEGYETNSDCQKDCPSCDDANACTKDSYDYDEQKCIHELTPPCYLKSITLTPAVPEIDYQIKIELTTANFDYSKVETNGEDIRFFDKNHNPLNYWIEDWNDTEGVSTVWVKAANSGMEKIYMYYGYPDASSASNGSAVFEYFEGFDYASESELIQVWNKNGSPVIELSDSIVTITTSGAEEHGGQYISKNVGAAILLNNIVEVYVKRFSDGGDVNHMANIGYASSFGGPINDIISWAVLRHSPSPDGGIVVFGGNHGGIASPPIGSFNIVKIYHQDGVSYAYEPPGTKVAEYSWPSEPPQGDYVLLGGQTEKSGKGKASYDWIRIRKYTSQEPSADVGNEEAVGESTIKEFYIKQ